MAEHSTKKSKLVSVDPSIAPVKIAWVQFFIKNTRSSASELARVLNFNHKPSPYDDDWLELKAPEEGHTGIGLHRLSEDMEKEGNRVGDARLDVFVKNLDQYHDFVKEFVKVLQEPTKQMWGGYQAIYEVENIKISALQEIVHEKEVEKEKEKEKEKENAAHSGICHLEIPCEDAGRVSKFYGDVFGWTFQEVGKWRLFKTLDTEYPLAGNLLVSNFRISEPIVHLRVANVNAALEKVKGNGGEVLKEEFSIGEGIGYNGIFKDTEGNVMAVYAKHK